MTVKEMKAHEIIAKKDKMKMEKYANKIIKLLKKFNSDNFVVEDALYGADLTITPATRREQRAFDEIIKLMNFQSHNVLGSVVVEVEHKLDICEFTSHSYECHPKHLYITLWHGDNVNDFIAKIS